MLERLPARDSLIIGLLERAKPGNSPPIHGRNPNANGRADRYGELNRVDDVLLGDSPVRGDVFQDVFQGAYPHGLVSGY